MLSKWATSARKPIVLPPICLAAAVLPLKAVVAVREALAGIQSGVEAHWWGRLLLWNAWPAYVFALLLVAKLQRLGPLVVAGSQVDPMGEQHYAASLAEQAANVLFLSVVVALFAIRRPVIGRRADWLGASVALCGTFILSAVMVVPTPEDAPTSALVAASAVGTAGTLFAAWSILALGRCLGIFPEARGLVQRGPYRWIRHPVYLGEIVASLGVILAKPHPLVVALYLVFVGLQYWRTTFEEAALSKSFPHAYPAYRERTGRLLPRWR